MFNKHLSGSAKLFAMLRRAANPLGLPQFHFLVFLVLCWVFFRGRESVFSF